MKMKIIVYCVLFMPATILMAQHQKLANRAFNIEDSVPDNITFRNVHNWPTDTLSFGSLKGKLVILDFWTTGCHSCFGAFPHLEELQNKFKDSLQIILVNPWESTDRIEQWVSKRKKIHAGPPISSLPLVYGDTSWRVLFPHTLVPHHVWIDEFGKVISITNGYNATQGNIQNWLKKRKLQLMQKLDIAVSGYNPQNNGLIVPAKEIHPLIYTAFERANFGYGQYFSMKTDTVNHLYSWLMLNLPIVEMYKNVFQIRPFDYRILLKTKYAEKMLQPVDPNLMDDWRKEYCFSYQITLPEKLKDSVYRYAQNDLNRYLSAEMGISASVEVIRYPAYVLIKQPSFSLKPEPNMPYSLKTENGNTYYKNYQWQEISFILKEKLENFKEEIIFEDETDLKDTDRYSLELPVNFNDIVALKACLEKQGLQLHKEARTIPALVIKDNQ